MKRTKVKVCCVWSLEKAHLALQYGVDSPGLVEEGLNVAVTGDSGRGRGDDQIVEKMLACT